MRGLGEQLDTIIFYCVCVSVGLWEEEEEAKEESERITWDKEAYWIQQREGVAIKEENRKRQQHQGRNQKDRRKLKEFRGTLTRGNCQVE